MTKATELRELANTLTVDEIEWIGEPPTIPLTNEEIHEKIAELFGEE